DVWPDEPNIESKLLEKVTVATPHVAGYSLEGKLNGTRELFRQFLDWQSETYPEPMPPVAPPPEELLIPNATSLNSAILAACPVERDDASLRVCIAGKNSISATEFDELRKNYPIRRDFAGIKIVGGVAGGMTKSISPLGFFNEPVRFSH
ncbi:MAG TPA: DUF3410 domain-containing protein, partial [Xanthomonadales bacterium]|nr:DUF3410 domain-containing protein [Xanthomonadales bacterium]